MRKSGAGGFTAGHHMFWSHQLPGVPTVVYSRFSLFFNLVFLLQHSPMRCKNQRPNPRPDLKRGREEGAAARRAQALGPATRNLTLGTRDRSRCSTRGTQGDWSCVRPKGPRLQPCACRLKPPRDEDVLTHVTLAGTGGKGSRQVPLWDQTRVWDPGD